MTCMCYLAVVSVSKKYFQILGVYKSQSNLTFCTLTRDYTRRFFKSNRKIVVLTGGLEFVLKVFMPLARSANRDTDALFRKSGIFIL